MFDASFYLKNSKFHQKILIFPKISKISTKTTYFLHKSTLISNPLNPIPGGYLKIDSEVGPLIDFYNIQFYNQQTTSYDSYETLFVQSNGWAKGTSVGELIGKGVQREKIVIGKPVIIRGLYGFGNLGNLGILVNYQEFYLSLFLFLLISNFKNLSNFNFLIIKFNFR